MKNAHKSPSKFLYIFLIFLGLIIPNQLLGQASGCAQHPCTPTPCPPPDSATVVAGDPTIHIFNEMLFNESYITYDSNGFPMINSFKGDTLRIQCGMIYKFHVEANGIYEWNTDISYMNVPTQGNDQLRTKITLFYDDFKTSAVVSDRAVNSTVQGNAASGLSWRANYTGTVGVMVTRGDMSLGDENFCACTPDTIFLRYNQRRRPDENSFIVWGRYGITRQLPCDNINHFIYDSGTNSQQDDASGDYSNNENGYLVLYPGDPRSKLKLWGSSLLECGDTLFIYNGDISTDPNIVPYDTITGPGSKQLGSEDNPVFMSAVPGLPITLRMQSDSTCTSGGFELQAKCCQNPGLPVNLHGQMVSDTSANLTWEPGEGNELYYNWDIYTAADTTLLYSGTTPYSSLHIEGLNPNECYFFSISVVSACSNDNATGDNNTDVVTSNVFCFSYFVVLNDSVQSLVVGTDSVYIPDEAYIDSTNTCECSEYGVNAIIHETSKRICYGDNFNVCYNFSVIDSVEINLTRKLIWESHYPIHFPYYELDTNYISTSADGILYHYETTIDGSIHSNCYMSGPYTEDGYIMLTAYTEGLSAARAIIHFTIDSLPDVRILVNGTDTSDIITCESTTLSLSGINATVYQWTGHPDILSAISFNDSIVSYVPIQNDRVSVIGTDSHNCKNYDTLQIQINPLPDLSYESEYDLCNGDSLLLHVEGIEYYYWERIDTIRWDTTYWKDTTLSGNHVCSYISNIQSDCGFITIHQTNLATSPIDTLYIDSIQSANFQCGYSGPLKRYQIKNSVTEHMMRLEYIPLAEGYMDSLWVRPPQDVDYHIYGIDTNGCQNREDAIIHVHVIPKPVITNIYSTPKICTNDTAIMSVTVEEGIDYSFEWRQENNDAILARTPYLHQTLDTSTTFSVRVIHQNGCDTTIIFPIALYPVPEITLTTTPSVICPGDSSRMEVTGPTIVNWLWNDSVTTNIRKVSPEFDTEYYVTGTDINGCAATERTLIALHPAPAHEVLENDSICIGNSVSLILSGQAMNYQWHTPGINPSPSGDTVLVSPSVTTTYTVSYNNSFGCSDTTEVTIAVYEFPTPQISPDTTICRDDSVRLEASGGQYFLWDNDDQSTTDHIIVAPTDTTTYTVTVYDYIHCGSQSQVTVNVIPHFQLYIVSDVDSICPNTEVTFTAYGGNAYLWNNDYQLQDSTITMTSDSTTTVSSIIVSLNALNNATNCSMTVYDTVVVMPYPIVEITAEHDTICYGDNTVLSVVSNADHYQWNPGALTGSSIQVSPVSNTSYNVTAYSEFNCVSTTSHPIVVNSLPPEFSIQLSPDSICYIDHANVSVILSSFSNLEYHWNYPDLGTNTSQFLYSPSSSYTTPSFTDTYTDTLTVDAVNIYGCHRQGKAVITVFPMPLDEIIGPTDACINDTFTLSLNGSYNYLWSSPVPQQQKNNSSIHITQTETTNYSVKVSTNFGCSINLSQSVENHLLPIININPGENYYCTNQSYTLHATGAQTYVWNTGEVGANLLISPPLSPTYSVTGTDENGCSQSTSYTLNIVSPPSVQINIYPADTICAGDSVTITAMGSNMDNILWSTNSTDFSIALNNVHSSQTITATSESISHGVHCYSHDTVQVIVMPVPQLIITSNNSPICSNDSGMLVVTGADSYVWEANSILDPQGNTAYIHPVSSTQSHTEFFTVWGILSEHECRSVLSIPFDIHGLPDISITSSSQYSSICTSDAINLQALGGLHYWWYEDSDPANPIGTNSSIWLSPNQNTEYYVYVENAHGCRDSMHYAVTVNGHPSLSISVSDDEICFGDTVQFEATSSGHDFVWNNAQTLNTATISNPVATPQATCTYVLSVTDTITHCIITDSVTVVVHQLPVISSDAPHSLCIGDSLHITMSGANIYDWYSDINMVNYFQSNSNYYTLPSEPPLVQYYVIGTDGFGCKDTLPIEVKVYDLPQLSTEISYPGYLCRNKNNFLGINVQCDIPYASFQWNSLPFDLSLINEGNVAFVSPDTTTTYFIKGSYYIDGVTCSSFDTATVKVYEAPDVHASVSPEAVCINSEAQLSVTGADHYLWFLNNMIISSEASFTHLAEIGQKYIVMGIDTNNCVGTDTISVNMVYTQPTDTITGPRSTCANVPVTVHTTGNNHCEWYPTTGLSNISDTAVTITLSETQTYTIQITDEHGCSDTMSFTMTVLPLPVIDMPHEASVCKGQSYSFRISGASAYLWADGSSNDYMTVSPDTTTTYVVTGFNQYNCSSTDSLVLTVIPMFDLHILASRDSFCIEDNAITLSAYGAGDTYEWSTGSTDSIITVYPTTTTSYTLTAYNSSLNCVTSVEHTITQSPGTVLTITSSNDYICKNDTVVISVSGNDIHHIQWSTNDTTTNIAVSPSVATQYNAIVTNKYGCTAEASVNIDVKPLPLVSIIADNNIVCHGSRVHLQAIGNAAYYQWNTGHIGDSLTINQQTDAQYYVTAYSEYQCTSFDSIYVRVFPMPEYNITGPSHTLCVGDTAIINISGDNTYVWQPQHNMIYNDSVQAFVNPEITTDYTAFITNNFGCTDSFTVSINVYEPLPLEVSNDTLICHGETVTLHVTGSWNYIWSNGETSSQFNVTLNETTVYSVSSTDEHGCTTTAQTTVFVQPDFDLFIFASRDSFCLEDNAITLAAYGAGDSLEWSTGSSDSVIVVHPTESTIYTLTAYNSALGCSTTRTYPIVRKPDPDFVILTNKDYICKEDSVTLQISHNNFTQVVWNTGDSVASITVSPESDTIYYASLTNIYGCHSSNTKQINVKPHPEFTIDASDTAVCYGEHILIRALGDADHYVWNTGYVGDSLIINNLIDTRYRITAYSEYQCTSYDSIDVVIYPLPTFTVTAPNHILCVGDTAVFNISGQNEWLWRPQADIVFNNNIISLATPAVTTDYTALITNQYGCIDSTTVHVDVYEPLPLQLTADTALCHGEGITLYATGSWNYLWDNGETSSSISVTPTETTVFSVSSIDDHGCVTRKSTTVQVQPDFNFELLVSKDTICMGDSTTLWFYGSADQHMWSTGSTDTYITEHPTSTSAYSIWAYNDATGCAKTIYTTIVVIPHPQLLLQSTQLICPYDSAIVSVSSQHPFSYQWHSAPDGSILSAPDSSTILVSPPQSSYYILTASNQFCEIQDSIFIETAELPSITVDAIHDETCEGRNGSIGITAASGYPPVTLSWSNGYTSSESQIYNLSAGTYSVTVTDHLGCSQTLDGIIVENITPPEIEVTNIEAMLNMRDGAVNLQVTHYYGDYTVEWFRDHLLTDRIDEYTNQLSIYGMMSGDYWVLITDEACSTIQEIHIPYVKDGEGTFYVPNSFTPINKDGINDYFSIYFSGEIEFQEIVIYSRWGEEVFRSSNAYFKWDGTSNGRIEKYNMFNYVIFYIDGDGHQKNKKGTVTVF